MSVVFDGNNNHSKSTKNIKYQRRTEKTISSDVLFDTSIRESKRDLYQCVWKVDIE